MKALTAPVLGLLIFTPLLIAVGQIFFKISTERLEAKVGSPYLAIMFQPYFIIGVAIYGAATLLWVYVLKSVQLSYAYSFMALSYVMVPLLAMYFLDETITARYVLGTLIIITGVLITNSR